MIPITIVSQLLGHRSRETTENIYLEPVRGLLLDLFTGFETAGEIESAQDSDAASSHPLDPSYPGCTAVTSAQ